MFGVCVGIQTAHYGDVRDAAVVAVQRELARRCGDRAVRWGGSEDTDSIIDYPCTLALPTATVDAAAAALRSDPDLLRALRRRIADLDTRLFDFTVNNRPAMQGLDAALADPR